MKKEFEREQKDNQIEDAFSDMPDMDDDEKFRQWLEEEYIKEADAIEESLFAGRRYEDNQDIAEKLSVSSESFYQRAREEGLLDEETVSEDVTSSEKVIPIEKKTSGEKKHSYVRLGRIAGIAGVCLICVFAASMSSEANRKYLVNSVRILSGNDSQLLVDNTADNEHANTEESDAIADIEKTLDIKMPEFYYRPYGMEFRDYKVNDKTCYAMIEYEYQDNVLFFYAEKQDKDIASNSSSLTGKEKTIDTISKDNIEITIKEIEDSVDEKSTYMASWKYNNLAFYIDGKIELEELKKIIKEMKF